MYRFSAAISFSLAIAIVACTSPTAHAVSDCAACEAEGGVWLTGTLGNFCMKKLEPILGPDLEPMPYEPEPDFELTPGNFNDAPGMSGYDTPLTPSLVGGLPITIGQDFVLSEPGQHTIVSETSNEVLGTVVLGDNQIALGGVAQWNGLDDLLLYTVLEASFGQGRSLDLTPVSSRSVEFTGLNALQTNLGEPTVANELLGMVVSFEGVQYTVPEPSSFALVGFAVVGIFVGRQSLRR